MSNSRQTRIRSLSAKYTAGHCVAAHEHSWGQLIYASEGVIAVETAQGRWVLPTHRAIWVPAHRTHQLEMFGRVWLQTIYVQRDFGRYGLAECTVVNVSSLLQELIKLICCRGIVTADNSEDRNLIQFVFYQLRKLKAEPMLIPLPKDERARRLANVIIASPGTAASLQALAVEQGASLRTMQRIFKQETGISLSRWRKQVRMFHALHLLSRHQSTTRIALELGYESLSAFIFAFRSFFGTTPGKFFAETLPMET